MRALAVLTVLFLLATSPAAAQFRQYTAPGSLAQVEITTKERIETGAEEARWNLGGLRLDPRFSLRNVAYLNNVFASPTEEDEVSDFRGTVGGGLAGYLHLGPKVIASGYVIPEYNWWREQADLRQWTNNFGLGVFGYFNRLSVQLDGTRTERQQFLNSELQVPTDIRQDRVRVAMEVNLTGPWDLFASVIQDRLRYKTDVDEELQPVDVTLLDRDELIGILGIEYTLRNGLGIGVGAEYSEAEFLDDPGKRSNSGTSPLLRANYFGNQFDLNLDLVYRILDFEQNAKVNNFEDLTGGLRLRWKPSERFEPTLYGGRELIYSASSFDSFYLEDLLGISFGSQLHDRLRLRVFGETGSNDYSVSAGDFADRQDDFNRFGGDLIISLTHKISLDLGITRTDYDSNLPGFDRTLTYFIANVNFGTDPLPW